ncbi:MAG TPA: decarboxylating NADP(+)-dependent phosphogluconate dehydrogenase [Treponemataceae bacterium]|nr:decarboxylating NADP(+)-dependent phosphogluconate dehydrogenase [Treponemataceae bacterium]
MKADIGFIGLAVMGENLVLNMERNGFTVAVYNRTSSAVDLFLSGRGEGKNFIGTKTVAELVSAVKRPRKIMMMIKAGDPVDAVISDIMPLLEAGDILIDGGNSNYEDTVRRTELLESKGLKFIGSGVSGGEEGALNGPSIMPGGSVEAWPEIQTLFQTIAAKGPDGDPCCDWIGPDGSGHYVKMIHNGIEYGDMQILSEIYWIMKEMLNMDHTEMASIFAQWNKGKLDSYLVDITSDILAFRDKDGKPLVEQILDTAGQKGTGKWTGIAALNEGAPLTLITESVFARSLSAQKANRLAASILYPKEKKSFNGNRVQFIEALHDALYAAKIVSYAQGFELIRKASISHKWNLDFAGIARLWRGGCIIRSVFLDRIADAFSENKNLENLIVSPYFVGELKRSEDGWRTVVTQALMAGIPIPALASSLTWFDGYRSEKLPANLLQAQRDYFGAHTYERIDAPRGQFFHTNWTGLGGDKTSTTYTV